MKLTKKDILILAFAVLPIIVIAALYGSLPEKIPMNWGFNGSIRYDNKVNIWFLTLMPLFFFFMFKFLPNIDPRKSNYAKFSKQYLLFSLMLTLFLDLTLAMIIFETFKPNTIKVSLFIPALVGLLLIFIGNMMPKFKNNYFIGIKTPWTLSSDEIWQKTHRFAGILWVIGGILMIIIPFVLPEMISFIVFMVITFIIVFVPILMSLIWFKKLPQDK